MTTDIASIAAQLDAATGGCLRRLVWPTLKATRDRKAGQGLHALRHNFEDALREAELHQTAIGQCLGGRAASHPVCAGYGAGDSGKRLFEAISKVCYPAYRFNRSQFR